MKTNQECETTTEKLLNQFPIAIRKISFRNFGDHSVMRVKFLPNSQDDPQNKPFYFITRFEPDTSDKEFEATVLRDLYDSVSTFIEAQTSVMSDSSVVENMSPKFDKYLGEDADEEDATMFTLGGTFNVAMMMDECRDTLDEIETLQFLIAMVIYQRKHNLPAIKIKVSPVNMIVFTQFSTFLKDMWDEELDSDLLDFKRDINDKKLVQEFLDDEVAGYSFEAKDLQKFLRDMIN